MATVTDQRTPGNWTDTDRRVRHPLQAVRGYIRSFVLLEGLGLALVYLVLAFWLGVFLDWGLFQAFAFDWVQELQEMTGGSGSDFWLRFSLLAIFVVGLVVVILMKTVVRLFREFSDTSMALLLERRFPRELGDRLITAVELADPKLATKYSYSLPMIEKTIREAAERVEKLPVRSVFNWARLRHIFTLFGVLSLGMYLLVGLSVSAGDALTGGMFDPIGFGYRFSDTAVIWGERNLALMDSYWPRSSYLEIVGFEDTAEHPGEMRVGRDEVRPDLQARAIEWVVADHRVRGGWRPMRFADLKHFMDASDLAAIDLPANWTGWIIDLDDIPGRVPGSAFPPDTWQLGLSSGTIRSRLKQPESIRAADKAQMTSTMNDLLDWQTWTVDRIALQLKKEPVRLALHASHPDAAKALEKIFGIRRPVFWTELKRAIEAKETEDVAAFHAGTLGLLVSAQGQGPLMAPAPFLQTKAYFPGKAAATLAQVSIPATWSDWVIDLKDITGQDGGTVTIASARIAGDETLVAVEKVRVQIGTGSVDEETKKLTFVNGTEVAGGLKNAVFAKEVRAIVALNDAGQIAEIRVLRGDGFEGQDVALESTGEFLCTIRKVDAESDFPPASWQGLTSGAIRANLKDADMAEKAARMTPSLVEQLDWQSWTTERIAAQLDREPVRAALSSSHPAALAALEKLLGKKPAAGLKELPELADHPSMSRRLRQLLVPEKVKVRYRGSSVKNDAECQLDLNNKYIIGLADLKESVRFTVIANDYYTPYRHITLMPPATLVEMRVDKEEPAYIHYRLQGEQAPLKGQKRSTHNLIYSVSGSETAIKIPLGTDLALTAIVEPERQINEVWISAPDKGQLAGAQVPDVPIELSRVFIGDVTEGEMVCTIRKVDGSRITLNRTIKSDSRKLGDEILTAATGVKVQIGKGKYDKESKKLSFVDGKDVDKGLQSDVFAKEVRAIVVKGTDGNIAEVRVLRGGDGFEDRLVLRLYHLTRPQEFYLYFRDQDKVKGKHQVRIVVDDDQPPELTDMELEAVLRNPRFRSDAGSAVTGPGWASEAFLITPDALLPIKGTVKDDYGLTKVEWKYEVEQVEIELQGDMPTRLKSGGGGNRLLGRVALFASGLQVTPGQTGMAMYGSAYLAWMSRMLMQDAEVKTVQVEEKSLPLESFELRLANHGGAIALADLGRRLRDDITPRELLRKHSWKGARPGDHTDDQDGFDVRKYLPKLKSPDPERIAQLHYYLKLSVSATDNNVETGPSSSRTKKPFQFLVVSATELQAQIGLEEELLSERLVGVFDKLGNAKTILGEQLAKLSEPEPKFAEIAIRVDQVTRAVSDGFGKTREVLGDFTRIREELEINRVLGKKYITVDFQIVKPLEKIVDPSEEARFRGEFPQLEDVVQKLQEELNGDVQEIARGKFVQTGSIRKAAVEQAQKKVQTLMDKLNDVLIVMQDEVNDQKLVNRAREIERRQRQLAERWNSLYEIQLGIILGELTKPSGK